MAIEKFPRRTHHDNPNHDGWRANKTKLEQAISDEEIGEQVLFSLICLKQASRLPESIVMYHYNILKSLGLIE